LLTMNNQTKLNKDASTDVPQDKEGNK